MKIEFSKTQIALAVTVALSGAGAAALPTIAVAAKVPGKYVAGDIHNHTTCSDGAGSMQRLIKKSTDKDANTPWGLDWFVQAGHGGAANSNNCTLVEDASLGTPAYPYVAGKSPYTSWAATDDAVGDVPSPYPAVTVKPNQGTMNRWQTIKEIQYPLVEYLTALRDRPMFLGLESIVGGHEHTSMSVITGQMPAGIHSQTLPTAPPYSKIGNADALAQWIYCFDVGQTILDRGQENQWDCTVPGSSGPGSANWNDDAKKLNANTGTNGHLKTVEGVKWIGLFHPNAGYYLPTHLERAGHFVSTSNNGFNIEHLRDFNNAAPGIAFGFESQPGHHASGQRGEYTINRNGADNDSVGGTTWGGTGVYAAYVGGVWDALLGEGRNYWFFGSSDFHNRGGFGTFSDTSDSIPGNTRGYVGDDRRSTGDFWPGEYQRAYSLVRNNGARLNPQLIVDGMRSGNSFTTTGQLIDRLAFVACASYAGRGARTNAAVEAIAVTAAANNTDTDVSGCATMGEKLTVNPGAEIVVAIVVRDPAGQNYSPYTFANPSLAQVGKSVPLDHPVLDHIDLIRGLVTSGIKKPTDANYSGEWPDKFIDVATMKPDAAKVAAIPAGARNPTTAVIKTFSDTTGSGTAYWTPVTSPVDGTQLLKMSYRIPAVSASQYLRLRGTNLPPATPWETDSDGNPLADAATNATTPNGYESLLRIPCTVSHSSGNQYDGCPDHLPNREAGGKWVAHDIAAWSDLWFYGNPIFIEVAGSQVVQGVL